MRIEKVIFRVVGRGNCMVKIVGEQVFELSDDKFFSLFSIN